MLEKISLQGLYRQLNKAKNREDYIMCAIIHKEQQRRCKVTKLPPFKIIKAVSWK